MEKTHRPDVLLRVGLCLLAAIVLWGVTRAWEPPFIYRVGDVLSDDPGLVIPAGDDAQSTSNELVRAGEPLSADMIQLLTGRS